MEQFSGSEDSRCWVFGSTKPLSSGDPLLIRRLNTFFSQWQSHGEAVSGRWRILFDRFLVILREPDGAQVSGCSIDSMVGEVKQIEKELGTSLLDSSRIFYKTQEGPIGVATRSEFKGLASEGRITPDTLIFDTTLTRLSDLEMGIFSKPVRESWHMKLLEKAAQSQSV